MLLLREADVVRLLPMTRCIALLREAFLAYAAGQAVNQPRRRLRSGASVLHSMAGASGAYFGTKVYSTHPGYGAWFLFTLYETATGRPLALVEANRLGQIRTGAATGLAVDVLARPEARVLGVIGSGFQAETQIAAIRAVRQISEVRVWSRNAERRREFARCMNAVAAGSAMECVAGADVVVTATPAKDPVLEAAWVQEDAVVCAVGSNYPGRRELPAELLERASRVIADSVDQAKIEAGDLLLGLEPDGWSRVIELRDLIRSGATHAPGISVFKSVGLGLEDVAAAAAVYESAIAEGGGVDLPLFYS
jgi:ornithine cyclodeaminase/alanine dehydrogenase-like protein (mu-crystallin family)